MTGHAIALAEIGDGGRLTVYRTPLAEPVIQARYGFSAPAQCMALRHQLGRPVADWVATVARPSNAEIVVAGFPLTAIAVFMACRECIDSVDPAGVRAFPLTEWRGSL